MQVPGRINQLIVNIIVSHISETYPDQFKDASATLIDAGFDAGFPLGPYRNYLKSVSETVGGQAILAAGKRLEGISDPFLYVLLNSDSVPLVIEKEARLGRFIHSRHVVRLKRQLKNGVVLEHVSNEPEAPMPEENLASAGLHISLLEQLGCTGLRLKFPLSSLSDQWVYDQGQYKNFLGGVGFHKWHFEWDTFAPVRKPMVGLDALLLSAESRLELAEAPAVVLEILYVAQTDMARTWTIIDVAKRLKTAPRTLQRALAQAETTFSKVITEWRLKEARRLLTTTELSVTDIGYICGFSDTSHFSRRFKGYYGVSPSVYPRRAK